MSDPTDIFKKEEEVKEPVSPQTTTDDGVPTTSGDSELTTILASIRNERGEQKYGDVLKALEGLKNAQEYIPQLKSDLQKKEEELTRLQEQLSRQASVEDIVSKLGTSQAKPDTTDASLDEQKATALFEQLMGQRQAQEAAANNKKAVSDKLVETFGSPEAAKNAIASKAAELGTTEEEIGELSARNPKMVLELFKTVQGGPKPTPPKSSVNSDAFLNQAPKEQTLQPPTKSLLAGATYKEQRDYLRQVREDVYKRFGISEN